MRCYTHIYKYTNLWNGKVYVGSTTRPKRRVVVHKNDSKTIDNKFYRAVRKWGWESFSYDVIEICCLLVRNSREQHWIDYYQTLSACGYNSCQAGFCTHTPESNKKISDALKGRPKPPMSNEHRRRISEAGKGRKHSDETKKKMSSAHKGQPGRPMPDWLKEKLREINKNRPNSWLGRKHSEESKQKMAAKKLGVLRGPLTAEHKANLSKGKKGKSNGLLGFKYSAEVCKKRSISMTGRKASDEARLNMSLAHRGIPQSEETKRLRSEALKRFYEMKKQSLLALGEK